MVFNIPALYLDEPQDSSCLPYRADETGSLSPLPNLPQLLHSRSPSMHSSPSLRYNNSLSPHGPMCSPMLSDLPVMNDPTYADLRRSPEPDPFLSPYHASSDSAPSSSSSSSSSSSLSTGFTSPGSSLLTPRTLLDSNYSSPYVDVGCLDFDAEFSVTEGEVAIGLYDIASFDAAQFSAVPSSPEPREGPSSFPGDTPVAGPASGKRGQKCSDTAQECAPPQKRRGRGSMRALGSTPQALASEPAALSGPATHGRPSRAARQRALQGLPTPSERPVCRPPPRASAPRTTRTTRTTRYSSASSPLLAPPAQREGASSSTSHRAAQLPLYEDEESDADAGGESECDNDDGSGAYKDGPSSARSGHDGHARPPKRRCRSGSGQTNKKKKSSASKEYLCGYCSKTFTRDADADRHRGTCSMVPPGERSRFRRKITCPDCGDTLSRRDALLRHMRGGACQGRPRA